MDTVGAIFQNNQPEKIWMRIWNVLCIIALIVILITLIFQRQSEMIPNLYILPFIYLISLLITRKVFKKQPGLALMIIETIMICRFLIIPFMFAFDNNYTGVSISSEYNTAVWFMAYEELVVSFMMLFWSSIKHKDRPVVLNMKFEKKMIRPVTIGIIVFWIFIIIVNPKLRGNLLNFSLLAREELFGTTGYMTIAEYRSDIPGIFSVFFRIGLIVLLTILVRTVAQSRTYRTIKVLQICLICIAFISSMWSNGYSVSRWNMLIAVIISVYVLLYSFPQNKKQIIFLGICGVIFVLLVGSALKTVSIKVADSISLNSGVEKYLNVEMFDEYFQGIVPVTNGIKTAEIFGKKRGLEGILADTMFNFPYAMKITGLSGTPVATDYFHQATGHYDLVMPTVAQSIMQFGKFLAPLYSSVLVLFSLWLDRKQQAAKTLYKKLFFTVLVFWTSLFMAVSTNIIEANIWYAVIAIWILTLEEKVHFKFG